MSAQCPTCHRHAVLDLHASMFHRALDFYSCQRCDQTWAVEKRTGRIIRSDAPPASPGAAAAAPVS